MPYKHSNWGGWLCVCVCAALMAISFWNRVLKQCFMVWSGCFLTFLHSRHTCLCISWIVFKTNALQSVPQSGSLSLLLSGSAKIAIGINLMRTHIPVLWKCEKISWTRLWTGILDFVRNIPLLSFCRVIPHSEACAGAKYHSDTNVWWILIKTCVKAHHVIFKRISHDGCRSTYTDDHPINMPN